MNASMKARNLTRTLRRLAPLSTEELAGVSGAGETASTSTSGTPAAGDDTVGDSSGGISRLGTGTLQLAQGNGL